MAFRAILPPMRTPILVLLALATACGATSTAVQVGQSVTEPYRVLFSVDGETSLSVSSHGVGFGAGVAASVALYKLTDGVPAKLYEYEHPAGRAGGLELVADGDGVRLESVSCAEAQKLWPLAVTSCGDAAGLMATPGRVVLWPVP